jgi:hypothetical protein
VGVQDFPGFHFPPLGDHAPELVSPKKAGVLIFFLSVNALIADFIRHTNLDKLAASVAVVDPRNVRVRFPQSKTQ